MDDLQGHQKNNASDNSPVNLFLYEASFDVVSVFGHDYEEFHMIGKEKASLTFLSGE